MAAPSTSKGQLSGRELAFRLVVEGQIWPLDGCGCGGSAPDEGLGRVREDRGEVGRGSGCRARRR